MARQLDIEIAIGSKFIFTQCKARLLCIILFCSALSLIVKVSFVALLIGSLVNCLLSTSLRYDYIVPPPTAKLSNKLCEIRSALRAV